jgi:hypothetical protein
MGNSALSRKRPVVSGNVAVGGKGKPRSLPMQNAAFVFRQLIMVELVGIELLRVLKTDKLLIRENPTMPTMPKTPAMPNSLYVYCTVSFFEKSHQIQSLLFQRFSTIPALELGGESLPRYLIRIGKLSRVK